MYTQLKSSAIVALTALFVLFGSSLASAQTVRLHVNIDSQATNPDGLSWNDAFPFLQDALDTAKTLIDQELADEVEIWVAQGTYLPDQDASNPNGTGNRSVSFELRNDVALYGGFPPDAADSSYGSNGATLDHRDWEAYPTILSGDLDDNDNVEIYDPQTGVLTLNFSHYNNNSFVVVAAPLITDKINNSAVLDGFIVRGASGPGVIPWSQNAGGAIWGVAAAPRIVNCVIEQNRSLSLNGCDGAAAIALGTPGNTVVEPARIENCIIRHNSGLTVSGLNMEMSVPDPPTTDEDVVVINTKFEENITSGCETIRVVRATFVNSSIVGQTPPEGGGGRNWSSDPMGRCGGQATSHMELSDC